MALGDLLLQSALYFRILSTTDSCPHLLEILMVLGSGGEKMADRVRIPRR